MVFFNISSFLLFLDNEEVFDVYLEAMNKIPTVRLAQFTCFLERSTLVHVELVTAPGEGRQFDFRWGTRWRAAVVREFCNLWKNMNNIEDYLRKRNKRHPGIEQNETSDISPSVVKTSTSHSESDPSTPTSCRKTCCPTSGRAHVKVFVTPSSVNKGINQLNK